MFSKAREYLVMGWYAVSVAARALVALVATLWLIIEGLCEVLVFRILPPFLLLMLLALAMDFSDRLT